MNFTINGRAASHTEAQAHFFAQASKSPTPELLAMCPNGPRLTLGDLDYVWCSMWKLSEGLGWEECRAEIEKTGVKRHLTND